MGKNSGGDKAMYVKKGQLIENSDSANDDDFEDISDESEEESKTISVPKNKRHAKEDPRNVMYL